MTAHVLYDAIDAENVATLSPVVIQLIREEIGFDGLLMTDDLSMKALKGDFAQLTRDALHAGCDVILHCNGKMDEMQAIASTVTELSGEAAARAERAGKWLSRNEPFDVDVAQNRLQEFLAEAAA